MEILKPGVFVMQGVVQGLTFGMVQASFEGFWARVAAFTLVGVVYDYIENRARKAWGVSWKYSFVMRLIGALIGGLLAFWYVI